MVETQLRRRGIRDARVLAAILEIPREEFVPLESRLMSYSDGPVGIGFGQTISQPYMTALMAEALELTGRERVLEVGAGCGYAAAVLGAIAREVISVEIVPELARLARFNLRRTGRDANVQVVEGDGGWGFAAGAPYDAISVAAAAPDVPAPAARSARRPRHTRHPGGVARRPGAARHDEIPRTHREPHRDAVPVRPAARRRGLALMRLRAAKDRLKIEHSIIDGVREILEEILSANAAIRSIIPGVIRPVRDARGKVRMRVTVPTQNGWKAIALSAGARQETLHLHGPQEGGSGGGDE